MKEGDFNEREFNCRHLQIDEELASESREVRKETADQLLQVLQLFVGLEEQAFLIFALTQSKDGPILTARSKMRLRYLMLAVENDLNLQGVETVNMMFYLMAPFSDTVVSCRVGA